MIWGILLGLYAPPLKKLIALAAVIIVGSTAVNYALMGTDRYMASRYTGEPLEVLANMAYAVPFIALGIGIGLSLRYVALKMAAYFAKSKRA